MRGSRSVARVAAYPQFRGLDFLTGAQRQRPCRMALEAVQDIAGWIESAVSHAAAIRVAGRQRHALDLGIVAEPMLDVPILIELADVGDGLLAGAECPLARRTGGRGSQRPGVSALRLSGKLRGVAR